MMFHSETALFITVFALLGIASGVGLALRKRPLYQTNPQLVEEIVLRTNAWWVMSVIILLAIALGFYAVTFLFFVVSLLALREYLSLIATRAADHRTLFWSFLIIPPIQYYLVAIEWYGLYSIFIPVYACIFVPLRMTLSRDCTAFLQRAAEIHWGLMLFVYLLSYAPALLTLHIEHYDHSRWVLLFYLVFITEMSDIMQFVSGKLFGRRKIAPEVSPNKTWEGLAGGIGSAMLIGVALSPLTPFTAVQSAVISFVIGIAGFFGGLTMSAIKRDIGVKDFGSLIAGHGGVIDRMDSLCFATPIFFHLLRYYFTV
ncbi:MAG: phosphatidate cytidylyltransferase [Bdellovibrionota bacterium]